MPNFTRTSRYRRIYGFSGQRVSDTLGTTTCPLESENFVSCNIFNDATSLQNDHPAASNSGSFGLVFSSSLPVTYQSNGSSWIFVAGSGSGGGQLSLSTQIVSSSLTASNSNVLLVNASGGDLTIHLPNAASAPSTFYHVKKTDQTYNSVFISASGSQTIDGSTDIVEIDYPQSIFQIVNNGSNAWFII